MILDGHTTSSFKDPLNYVLSPEKQPEIIGGRCIGDTAAEIAERFSEVADLGRSQKPCKHFYLAFAPEDGELSVIDKAEIADEIVYRLGYTNNQYVTVNHGRHDPSHPKSHDHDHLHIIINAVDQDSTLKVNDSFEIRRGIEICRSLEKEWGLTQVNNQYQSPFTEDRMPRQHQERLKREKKEYEAGKRNDPPKQYYKAELQTIINEASGDQPSLPTFFDRLIEREVIPKAYVTEKGRKRISYAYQGIHFQGSKLNDASFPKLIKNRGIDYNPERDQETMERASRGELSLSQEQQKREAIALILGFSQTPKKSPKTVSKKPLESQEENQVEEMDTVATIEESPTAQETTTNEDEQEGKARQDLAIALSKLAQPNGGEYLSENGSRVTYQNQELSVTKEEEATRIENEQLKERKKREQFQKELKPNQMEL